MVITRRVAIAGAAATFARAGLAVPSEHAAAIAAIERRAGGRLGVFALDLQTHRTLAHRADERFKLFSTFKGLLAALVLVDVARGRERLDAAVRFGRADLVPTSPVTEPLVDRGVLTVRELCAAMMHRGDNTAANLLLARHGGPRRLIAFLRRLGDRTTRIDSYEGDLDGHPPTFDTTSPRAITQVVQRIFYGAVLEESAKAQLEQWMAGNVVGRTRLRAAFPADWRAGDRTGTGDGICNDYAFAHRPGKAPLLVSAYHAAPGLALADQEAALREVGRIVVAWQRS